MAGAPVPVPTSSDLDEKILSIADLEKAASKKLGKNAREFYNSGSTDQITIHENSTSFSKYRLRPRVLVDVSGVDTSTTVFGRSIAFPLSVSPAGLQAMAHPDGEVATSKACARKCVNMAISSFSNYSVEDVRAAAAEVGGVDHAIQLYTMRDREMQERIIRTAEEAGCKAIFLTADSPVLGVRYNEWRNDFRTPEGLEFPIIGMTSQNIRSRTHDSGFVAFNDDSHSWERDIPWLRQRTKMQIWIKGVLTAEDTELAVRHGCDGIIVSNHGGRQLDGVMATLDALPECVDAAKGRIAVHVDGGFRSGTDIFKALALGADCCWVGRPAIWGLAYDGEAGVHLMLEIMHNEFRRCMQLTGCKTVKDISKACLARVNADGILKRL
ncbi:(S)-2-hydroxy-acid oxidase [Usnea florida]